VNAGLNFQLKSLSWVDARFLIALLSSSLVHVGKLLFLSSHLRYCRMVSPVNREITFLKIIHFQKQADIPLVREEDRK